MNEKLKIDPEFRDKIPPLTDDEFRQLEENILEAGEVYEPIRVWNGVIIDGHNQYKVILAHPEIKWTTREMDFPDKWAAFEWMYKNQLGRRNLTNEQKTYMLGKMYEARTKSKGRKKNWPHNEVNSQRTAGKIAEELGVGSATVVRAAKFAKGIDALKEISQEAADKVLSGASKAHKCDIRAITDLDDESRQKVSDLILADESPSPAINLNGGSTYNREMTKMADEIAQQLADVNAPSTYNMNDLIVEIQVNGEKAVQIAKHTVEQRRNLLTTKEEKCRVKDALMDIVRMFKEVAKSV